MGNGSRINRPCQGARRFIFNRFRRMRTRFCLPVSTNGGAQPRWGSDNELFYIALDGQLMSVPIHYSPDGREIRPETPASMFATRVGVRSTAMIVSNMSSQIAVSGFL